MATDTSYTPDYQVTGRSDRTIFLLHGAFGSKDYWKFRTERFVKEGFRVVAWDAPGYGVSPLPESVTLNSIASAAARLIEKTGTGTNVLVGHSMGGQISPRICKMIPNRIQALVISSTIGWFGNKSREEQEAFVNQRSGPSMGAQKIAAGSRALVDQMFGPASTGPEVDLVKDTVARTPAATFQASIQAIKNSSDEESVAAIEALRIPTLCIAGEHDQTGSPEGMRRLAARIKGSEFEIIPGAGHYGWAESPDVFTKHVLGFIDRKITRAYQTNALTGHPL